MGWTYKHRKMREKMRQAYTEETGREDYRDPAFLAWAEQQEAGNPSGGAQFCADSTG